MAVTRGCLGQVLVGANVVAETRTWEMNVTRERIDASATGSCVRKFTLGPEEVSGTFTCWHDSTDTTGQEALLGTNSVTLIFYPYGTGSGLPKNEVTAVIEQISERFAFDGNVERDFTYVAESALDRTPQT